MGDERRWQWCKADDRLQGYCRAPIYYAAGSIEEGKGRIVWRDRYFEGDWEEHGTVEKTGFIIFAGSPDGVMDEFHNPYAYNLFRLDTQGGHDRENYWSRAVRY